MISVIFSTCSLIYVLIISIAYFSKKRIETAENKNYSALLVCNIFGLIIDVLGYCTLTYASELEKLNLIIGKFYLCYYFMWTFLFMNYILITSKTTTSAKRLRRLSSLDIFFAMILMFPILLLPLDIVHNGSVYYSSGLAIVYLVLSVLVMAIISVIAFVKSFKAVAFNKKIPLIVFFAVALIISVVQIINPTLLLITFAETIVTVLMYFTIENPDVAMLEEFKIAKNRAEKANEEKEVFLYDITQNIRMPLNDIKRASSWLDSNASDITVNDIHDGTYYINNKATSILDKVNNVLDITNMELTNIKVYQSKYDVGNIIDYIKKTYKSVDGVNLIYTIDSNIPKELYGDSLRLKQLLSILMDNAFKYTDEGSIELKLNTIVKKDVCRLIITVEDTGCGIKASEIDNIFNKDNQLYNNLDKIDDSKKNLAIAKSIANLLGGILLLDSEIGKGTKITLVLDQTIYKEKSSELNKLEEDAEKYIGKKNVMVVVEDAEYMAKVLKKLSKYDINVEAIDKGAKCIERIRLKHKYDLIIMDEMLRDLSSLEILKKLQKITNFNTPICLLTDNIENENFISEGFKYLVDKKLTKKDLDNLMKEIV